ncbi:hypothetical protein GCM10010185_57330 [Saccharothrix coeruleofusca]|uniref:Uncharacterized protein n=1 Tax=Saccharothrix coeruleofusca TaxID=33919 RepID=A0A918AS34_9PSEU|nr:hypothetical protein GCM10010185_57330 [Saccharothrix coeruleofusca]
MAQREQQPVDSRRVRPALGVEFNGVSARCRETHVNDGVHESGVVMLPNAEQRAGNVLTAHRFHSPARADAAGGTDRN